MSQPDEPFSESHLESPEYRERLLRKLNCLIAVLEVATAKVRKSLAGPEADTERLTRIRTNLQSTLDVCLRARAALERREALPDDIANNLVQVVGEAPKKAPTPTKRGRDHALRLETASDSERAKFERLGPIDPRHVRLVDIDMLSKRLLM
ncbi:MAG: hypothetical protein JNL28_14940 [Planctomycetes bacterium]|nr:hypothetical protein [Planctomycetota bacterium]